MNDSFYKLHEMLCKELEEITDKGSLSAGDLDAVDKITHSIKSLETIIAMGGYSCDYRTGNSYATYQGRDHMGRYTGRMYSRDSGRSYMVEQLENMMQGAATERERDAIRRCISALEK